MFCFFPQLLFHIRRKESLFIESAAASLMHFLFFLKKGSSFYLNSKLMMENKKYFSYVFEGFHVCTHEQLKRRNCFFLHIRQILFRATTKVCF